MLDDVAKNILVQYGALGLLVGVLILGNIAQWTRALKKEKWDRERDQDQHQVDLQTSEALSEMNTILRERKR